MKETSIVKANVAGGEKAKTTATSSKGKNVTFLRRIKHTT